MNKYDAIIIGAGIGGVAAGVRLVLAGYKPLILEKQNVIGGRYYSGDYKGYRLTTAAWYVTGDNGPVMQLAKDSGVESKVEIGYAPLPYWKYYIDGEYLAMPEKGGAKGMLSLVAGDEEVTKVAKAMTRATRWQEPGDNITFREWISEFTDNERIIKMYDMAIHNVTGVFTDSVPAGEFIRIIKHLGMWGSRWRLPKGHVGPLIDAFVDVIKSNGGDLWTKARVKKIIVEDLTAKGVIAEIDGKEMTIEAPVVINNSAPKVMVQLAGKENFDKGYLKRIDEMKPGDMLNIYWKTDKPVFDYYGPICYPLEKHPFIAVDYTLMFPDLAPEGKNTILALWGLFPPYDIKKEIDEKLDQIYTLYPVLKEHGEVLVAQVFRGSWPGIWALPGYDIENKSPVENLYVVGDGAKPRGTVVAEGAVAGANLVVEDIKKRFKPLG